MGMWGISVVFFWVFLVRVVWVDWMVLLVFVFDMMGDWGLRGSGGGVFLGLELFYLFFISDC